MPAKKKYARSNEEFKLGELEVTASLPPTQDNIKR